MSKQTVRTANMNALVRQLDKFLPHSVLLQGMGGVFLGAVVHTDDTAEHVRKTRKAKVRRGSVEYLVTDGPPGARSVIRYFTDIDEACTEFEWVRDHGWETPRKPTEPEPVKIQKGDLVGIADRPGETYRVHKKRAAMSYLVAVEGAAAFWCNTSSLVFIFRRPEETSGTP